MATQQTVYVYLTESARGFAESDLGREVVEYSFNDTVSSYGRIETREHYVDDSGWLRFEAIPSDPGDSTKKLRLALPPHAVSGVAVVVTRH